MGKVKIAISIEKEVLSEIDGMVMGKVFPNRSQAIQKAVEEKVERINKNRLAAECSKLDPQFERALAEEGLAGDIEKWPEY
ncbi:CopG family transcriptional regulator [bacterium]|nr:CopG family transcriptional regulator [bacterium]